MNLDGNIKIAGHEFPKKPVVIGTVITLGIGGVVLYRKHQENAGAAVSGSSGDTTNDSEIDPATGYAYGSAEDTNALAEMESQQSSGSFQTGNVIGYDQFGNPVYGTGSTVTGAFSSNAEWTQAVLTSVEDNGGDVSAMTAAIGAYLQGQPLSDAQVSLVQQAIALENQPPVPGANGYPPAYKTATPTGGGTPGGGTGTSVKKPSKPITGLNVGNIQQTSVQLRWTNQAGATSYRVRVWNSPTGGIVHDSKQAATSVRVTGLKAGHHYGFHVAAVNSAGQGPYSATKTFSTAAAGHPVTPGG